MSDKENILEYLLNSGAGAVSEHSEDETVQISSFDLGMEVKEMILIHYICPLETKARFNAYLRLKRMHRPEQVVTLNGSGRIVPVAEGVSLQTLCCGVVVGVKEFVDNCVNHE
ncbi:hypothetical protein NPIL_87851 [Nephila pilipes]|uniref:Uncharacterized protein n=1 Tax=Nephila pilipes TaxID=299642 RepID=A0A8X6P3E6_NEPPI|nr:hypothetical protein NPIL_87851 [Nephila pilipes]